MLDCKTLPASLLFELECAMLLLEALRARREDIVAAGRRYGARRIRVFGSVARGEESAGSDVDFLVDLPRGYDLFAQRIPLAESLAEITGRKVDVVPEHELSRHIRPYVLAEAVDL
jgi:predicted nucleotidyltransferase